MSDSIDRDELEDLKASIKSLDSDNKILNRKLETIIELLRNKSLTN